MNEKYQEIMKKFIQKIINWFKTSSRYKHLIGGMAIGVGANDWYCAAYAGVGIAAALELKDKLWGGKPDRVDFLITVVGVVIGYAARVFFLNLIK